MEIKLSKTIHAHGEDIDVLKFREMTTKDIIRNGMPLELNGEGEATINTKIIAKYVSDLAAIPPTAVNDLAVNDFIQLQNEVINFFGNGQAT